LEDLETDALEYTTVGEFLVDLRKEIKVTELKKVEQRTRTIKKFFQEFRRVVRRSRYEGRSLVEEFK